ncbi:MAG: TlpA disulfide reductase family protein [Sulfuricellaceae bacterium]|nr:TlpA disulfide reductase family protein [Sulfuricellaceae bacterium]
MKKLCVSLLLVFLSSLVAAEGLPSRPLYEAEFQDMNGQPFALSSLRGKVAVVNFWASWCAPCRKEIPDLVEVHRQYETQGVAFVGIAVEDNPESIRDFVRTFNMDFQVVMGREKAIVLMQQFGNAVAGLPYTLVLDAQGEVVDQRRGAMSAERLKSAVRAALTAIPSPALPRRERGGVDSLLCPSGCREGLVNSATQP